MKSDANARSSTVTRYNLVAVSFHWLLAVLIPGMIAWGWYMVSIEEQPGSVWYFNLHKSVGIVVIALVLLRLFGRLTHKPPTLPSTVPHWQAIAARWVQWLLYAVMIVMPLVGFTGALFSKVGISFFGLPIPRLVAPDHATAETFFTAHSFIAWVLVVLISLHVLGGLKHLLVDKDGVFQRMWHW
jgi:cytochrome b561